VCECVTEPGAGGCVTSMPSAIACLQKSTAAFCRRSITTRSVSSSFSRLSLRSISLSFSFLSAAVVSPPPPHTRSRLSFSSVCFSSRSVWCGCSSFSSGQTTAPFFFSNSFSSSSVNPYFFHSSGFKNDSKVGKKEVGASSLSKGKCFFSFRGKNPSEITQK